MKVRILIDNIAGCSDGERFEGRSACRAAPHARKLFGEWGLSVYAEYEGHKVLLDTGASHLFAKNANVMGVDLSQVDIGVLSHAHKVAHLRLFVEGVAEIAPGITLVPHSTAGLERIGEMAHLSVKENGKYRYDSFDHEQSLVFDTPQGLFIMNSCSHAGADNIVKEIEAAFPSKNIYAILGGFHLFRYPDARVRAFAERLRELNVQKIYTGHCTGDRAYGILRDVLGERTKQMHTGLTIEI